MTKKTAKISSSTDAFLPYSIVFYKAALDDAAHSALIAFGEYGDAIKRDYGEADAARHLQNALTYCAAVSRYFWPPQSSSELAKLRARILRDDYQIYPSSPLANRSLRNEFEHFDEKLDQWIQTAPVGPIIASTVFAHHSLADDEFGHIFKLIDIDNDIAVVLGRKYEFGALVRAIARLVLQDEGGCDDESEVTKIIDDDCSGCG